MPNECFGSKVSDCLGQVGENFTESVITRQRVRRRVEVTEGCDGARPGASIEEFVSKRCTVPAYR